MGATVGFLALALPNQYQAKAGQPRAIACPLDFPDHEARGWPGNHAGALTDPEQADCERKEAKDEQQVAHGFSSGRFLFGPVGSYYRKPDSFVTRYFRYKKAPDEAGAF
jgi:hypothetical protein